MKPGALIGGAGVLCGILLLAAPVAGQIDAEVRGGVTVGNHTGTAAGLDLVPKLSYEASMVVGVRQGVAAYAALVRTAFGCEEGFCLERDPTVVGTHGAVGVELRRGIPWLRVGFLYGTTKVGAEADASDAGAGVLGAVGLTLGSGRLRFVPGVSLRRFSAGTATSAEHVTAVAVGLGVRVRLGGTGDGAP